MSAPKVTTEVLAHPSVLEKRRTAQAAVKDWLEQIARTSIDEHVQNPDDVPPEYVNEWFDRLCELAWVLDRAEQELFLAMFEDLAEWGELNRAAVARMRVA